MPYPIRHAISTRAKEYSHLFESLFQFYCMFFLYFIYSFMSFTFYAMCVRWHRAGLQCDMQRIHHRRHFWDNRRMHVNSHTNSSYMLLLMLIGLDRKTGESMNSHTHIHIQANMHISRYTEPNVPNVQFIVHARLTSQNE